MFLSSFSPGSLPLRRRMDDEEEDMSQPISQLWGTPFRGVRHEDRVAQIAAGQALAAVTAAMSTSQSHSNNSVNALPCSLQRQPCLPFHGKELVSLLKVMWACSFRNMRFNFWLQAVYFISWVSRWGCCMRRSKPWSMRQTKCHLKIPQQNR